MKELSSVLFVMLFSQHLFASDTPCNEVGTIKDPHIIRMMEYKKPDPEESLKHLKDQHADAVRCKNKADAARFKMYIEGLEDAIARDKAKKAKETVEAIKVADTKIENKPITEKPITEKPIADKPIVNKTVDPVVVKKISVNCEDESTKPKTVFQIFGTDTNGVVEAVGYKDQMYVRLTYDNRNPKNGRTIEVTVNGETNKLSLNPGLGTIGFKPGFVMRMLLKTIGMNSDIKINCMPQTQAFIAEPVVEVPAPKEVVDANRDRLGTKTVDGPTIDANIKVEEKEKNQDATK